MEDCGPQAYDHDAVEAVPWIHPVVMPIGSDFHNTLQSENKQE